MREEGVGTRVYVLWMRCVSRRLRERSSEDEASTRVGQRPEREKRAVTGESREAERKGTGELSL